MVFLYLQLFNQRIWGNHQRQQHQQLWHMKLKSKTKHKNYFLANKSKFSLEVKPKARNALKERTKSTNY